MYVRVKPSHPKSGEQKYLCVLRSHREGRNVNQEQIANLGRKDLALAKGIGPIIKNKDRLNQHFEHLLRLRESLEHNPESKGAGFSLVFERVWHDLGYGDIVNNLTDNRRFKFNMERALFSLTLRAISGEESIRRWIRKSIDYNVRGFDKLRPHHLYRARDFIGELEEKFVGMLPLGRQPKALPYFNALIPYEKRGDGAAHEQRTILMSFDPSGMPIYFQIFPTKRIALDELPDMYCASWDGESIPILLSDRYVLNESSETVRRKKQKGKRGPTIRFKGRPAVMEYPLLDKAKRYDIDLIMIHPRSELKGMNVGPPRRTQAKWVDHLPYRQKKIDSTLFTYSFSEIYKVKHDQLRLELLDEIHRIRKKYGAQTVKSNPQFKALLNRGSAQISNDKVEADSKNDGKVVLVSRADLRAEQIAGMLWTKLVYERAFCDGTYPGHFVDWMADDSEPRNVGDQVVLMMAMRMVSHLQGLVRERETLKEWVAIEKALNDYRVLETEHQGLTYRITSTPSQTLRLVLKHCGVRIPSPISLI